MLFLLFLGYMHTYLTCNDYICIHASNDYAYKLYILQCLNVPLSSLHVYVALVLSAANVNLVLFLSLLWVTFPESVLTVQFVTIKQYFTSNYMRKIHTSLYNNYIIGNISTKLHFYLIAVSSYSVCTLTMNLSIYSIVYFKNGKPATTQTLHTC